ncbi:MAG TPA: hypothetical protein VKU19_32685 [Bryobacteraceae bacterium]|nr:hypothetical protein [Bryobacteraceae bacterium]
MKSGSLAKKAITAAPRVAVFLAGVVAGACSLPRKPGSPKASADLRDLRKVVTDLEGRVAAQEAAAVTRFVQIEARLDEHAAKLADVPSTTQIVAAMEQLLVKTMAGLEGRLTDQARSIQTLKVTVSQTDSVLERILESLDTLTDSEQPKPTEAELLQLTS